MNIRTSTLIMFVLIVSHLLPAQIRYTNYDYTSGLPVDHITEIAEDSMGYLWIGSNQGLVRFDGTTFNHFLSDDSDSSSIYDNEISDIQVAANGDVWISFETDGISIYRHQHQSFVNRHYKPTDDDQFPKGIIRSIYLDNRNRKAYLLGRTDGLFVLDMDDLSSKRLLPKQKGYHVAADMRSPENLLVSGSQLVSINLNTSLIDTISAVSMQEFTQEDDILYGYGWSGKHYEFNLKDKASSTLVKSQNYVNHGLIRHQGQTWVADYRGIQVYDNKSYQRTLARNIEEPFPLQNENLLSIFKDSKERIWLGTTSGLSVIHPQNQVIEKLQNSSLTRYIDIVNSAVPNEYYVLSFYDEVIDKINLHSSELQSIKTINNLGGFVDITTSNDTFFLMCFRGLAYMIDQEDEIVDITHQVLGDVFSRSAIGQLEMDQDGNMYLSRSTMRSEFLAFQGRDFTNHKVIKIDGWDASNYIKVLRHQKGVLWIGAKRGLYKYDIQRDKVSKVEWTEKTAILDDLEFEEIFFDKEGAMWILSTTKYMWKCQTHQENDTLRLIKRYSREDGLANNRPKSITQLHDDRIVIGSQAGFSFSIPGTDRFVNRGKAFGLEYANPYVKALDEKLFLMSKGLFHMPQSKLTPSKGGLATHLTKVDVNNKKYTAPLGRLLLSPSENSVRVHYKALDLSYPLAIKYRYRLLPDSNWTYQDYRYSSAYYYKLAPGEYTFEVQAASEDQQWGPLAQLSIKATKPFWKQLWFLIFSLCLLGFLVYAVYKYRIAQIAKVANLKTRMMQLEHEALRSQMNPHFLFNSLNSIKSFIINNERDAAADYLTTFSHLIRKVLANSKQNLISLEEELEALQLYMELENVRLNNKFEVRWRIDSHIDTNNVLLPPLTMQPFVENSIWHGFIHKEEQGLLTLDVKTSQESLLIKIIDNGIGREQSRAIEQNRSRKRSYGIDITEKRLASSVSGKTVNIEDLTENGSPSGTSVTITIPLMHKASHTKSNSNE